MGKLESVSRRSFLISTAVVGGGMALGFNLSESQAENAVAEFTPWITVASDGLITVRSPMPDWGNGTVTQWAMTIAEELNCDWSKIAVEYASPQRMYLEGKAHPPAIKVHFSGARSTLGLRVNQGLQLGASARERLKAAAAGQWKVPVTEITTANSVLTHTPTGRTLKYGDVAAKAATVKLEKEPAPKPRSEWTLLGKATPGKITNKAVVNGSAIYGMDVRLPGMVYAALRQVPAHGGRIKSYDDSVVKKMPGVLAVVTVDPKESVGLKIADLQSPYGDNGMQLSAAQVGIAVIAEHYWQARKALDALRIEWDESDAVKWKNIDVVNEAAHALLDSKELKAGKSVGDVAQLDKQEKIVEGVYRTPYCDQAMMEPLNGTALVTPERIEVWHPAQQSLHAYVTAIDETGMPPEKVVFHQTQLGGGFGRRLYADDVRMVVAVARKFPGRPVHTIWSREETMRQGRYRSLAVSKLRAGLDKQTGMPVAAHFRYVNGPGGADTGLSDTPYSLNKNFKVEGLGALPFNILTGAYRGPGYNSYAFMTETFIDECAHAAGIDPVEYRLKLLDGYPDPGWALCLKEASSKAGWGKPLPKGWGRGVAISNWGNTGKPQTGTTACTVATVEVTKAGKLKVHQLDVAFDTGGVMNRDAVVTEMVGGTIFGLNMTLNEGLTIRNGRIVEGNYDEYPMLRMADIPKINVHFGGLSGHERFTEVGEPPAGVVGPAVGNAIFAATGKRLRTTPFRLHDLSWA